MKCQACDKEVDIPFRCPYCGGAFCGDHRLPENHNCARLGQARTDRQGQVMQQQGYNNYSYSYVYGQDPYKKQRHITSSPKELKHLGIAVALVLGIGYSMFLYTLGFGYWTEVATTFFAVFMMVSFLTHEIAHKIAAQKAGLWAEFRLTTWGAVLTFASVFLPFRMIAPGAMMIGGQPSNAKDMLKISIAGVVTNIVFSVTFLTLALIIPFDSTNILYYAALLFLAYINAFMALFNMIPFGVLDGYKVFMLNKKIWAVVFAVSIALVIPTYLLFSQLFA
jgi:Zn-dependent protease